MRESWIRKAAGVLLLVAWGPVVQGDVVFDLVTIDHPGNAPDYRYNFGPPYDPIYRGGVSYVYQISRYEVRVGQYVEFLNWKAKSDPHGLWCSEMAGGPGVIGGAFILRSGEEGSYSYSAVDGKEDQPVRWVDFYDAMRFVNWLENGQGEGDTEDGTYDLTGPDGGLYAQRKAGAHWVIPTEDEWYKAAYYDAASGVYYDYPNGSDEVPEEPTDETTPREMNFGDTPYWKGSVYFTSVGETTGATPWGVRDMGGNVREWTETFSDSWQYRIVRGGSFLSSEEYLRASRQDPTPPGDDGKSYGFRVAYLIPEPGVVALLLTGGVLLGVLRRRRRW